MKLRNILITAAAVGFMFASADRVGVVGYSAGDYADMGTYPHMSAGQNVAYTAGSDFNAVWTDAGTTWGFSSGATDELVNMMWSNGTYGLAVGLNMDSGTASAEGETSFDLGFGMNLAGWDVGFAMSTVEDSDMTINARGSLGFWAFDTLTFGMVSGAETSTMNVDMYGTYDWGAATGMFGMGFMTTDDTVDYAAWMPSAADAGDGWSKLGDGATLINTNFSVESTLTDWCDLRIGYTKTFNMGPETGEPESFDSYRAGLGFNYGSVQLDMTITETTLGSMMSNPLEYINGRNNGVGEALAASWTLSYTW
jgi:hypothetical protein